MSSGSTTTIRASGESPSGPTSKAFSGARARRVSAGSSGRGRGRDSGRETAFHPGPGRFRLRVTIAERRSGRPAGRDATGRQTMKKTVVHILSTPYAGSHYLSLLLGSNSRALHLGEVFHLERGIRDKAGLTYHSSEVLEGIGPDNIEKVYEIIGGRVGPEIEVLV